MDQPTNNFIAEAPKPERIAPRIEGGELTVPEPEKRTAVGPGEMLKQANNAVNQAVQGSTPLPVANAASPVPTPMPINAMTNSNPVTANDVDVIEKEWVQKAKEIVGQTREDPHKQSVELTKFKHDYMKKRYGKEMKLPKDQLT